MRAALAAGVLLCCSSCGESGYRVVVRLPAGAADAARVEVSVLRSCGDLRELGADPPAPLRTSLVTDAGAAPLGTLDAGTFGLYGRAWDDRCRLFAAGCDPFRVEGGGNGSIEVFLTPVPERGCAPGEVCGPDGCTLPEPDSGVDGGRDGGPDAGSEPDAGDGGPDGGTGLDAGQDAGCETEPEIVASFDTVGEATGIALLGEHALVAAGADGLLVIDVSDPLHPALASTVETGGAHDVAVSGDLAFVADVTTGLRVVDLSNPDSPVALGTGGTFAWSVTLAGSLALVTGKFTFRIFDVADPAAPELLTTIDTPDIPNRMAISDTNVFFGDQLSGMQVVDFSDPVAAAIIGTVDTPGLAIAVALVGELAFVGDWTAGLQVIDVTDPTNPTVLGSVDTPGNAVLPVVAGQRVFLTDGTEGLQVVNVADPASPTIERSIDTPEEANELLLLEGYAMVADGPGGLQIIDLGCAAP